MMSDPIVVGGIYRRRSLRHVGDCCAWLGGLEWDESKPACWKVRTLESMSVRVRGLAFTDPRLGPCYRVTPVKPDLWQMRAWAGRDLEGVPPERWHTIAYIVPANSLGARVTE